MTEEQKFEYSQAGWIKNWFSNMVVLDNPIRFGGGWEFNSVETFFQAMKTTDVGLRKKISQMSPYQAKKFCSKRANNFTLRSDWEDIKLQVMDLGLRKKFTPGSKWANQLLATGDEPIVEFNNWHDCEWGHCICDRCKGKEKKNLLGKLLMAIREDLSVN